MPSAPAGVPPHPHDGGRHRARRRRRGVARPGAAYGRHGHRSRRRPGSLGWFAVTWLVMTAAMMLPVSAPVVVQVVRAGVGRRGDGRRLRHRLWRGVDAGRAGRLRRRRRRCAHWTWARSAGLRRAATSPPRRWSRPGCTSSPRSSGAGSSAAPPRDRHLPRPGVVRRACGRRRARRLLRRVLLDPDGRALRARDHEHHLDGPAHRPHRRRAAGRAAVGRRARPWPRCSWCSAWAWRRRPPRCRR